LHISSLITYFILFVQNIIIYIVMLKVLIINPYNSENKFSWSRYSTVQFLIISWSRGQIHLRLVLIEPFNPFLKGSKVHHNLYYWKVLLTFLYRWNRKPFFFGWTQKARKRLGIPFKRWTQKKTLNGILVQSAQSSKSLKKTVLFLFQDK